MKWMGGRTDGCLHAYGCSFICALAGAEGLDAMVLRALVVLRPLGRSGNVFFRAKSRIL
jgi:hypothetical protein